MLPGQQEVRKSSGHQVPPQNTTPKTPYRNPTVVIPPPSSSSSARVSTTNEQHYAANQIAIPQHNHSFHTPTSRTQPKPGSSANGVSKSVITPDLPVDYRILLLSLSDYYITEARSVATLIAHNQRGADTGMYYKLMATGIGCLEAVLKKVRVLERKDGLHKTD